MNRLLFNDKGADELVILDIDASRQKRPPDINYLSLLSKEAFMPMAYGGGINDIKQIKRILDIGYEKIILDSIALRCPAFVTEAASICGSQSIVVCADIKKKLLGRHKIYNHITHKTLPFSIREYAKKLEELGAGEIIVYSVDRDGTYLGYDIDALKKVTSAVRIPVVALGGCGRIQDFSTAVSCGGVSAVAAGSLFVFHGPNRAVLITYPDKKELIEILP